jgi:hypothetical protein
MSACLRSFADHQDRGGRTVAGHVVLRGRSARDQGGGGVLDLHLVEEDVAVLGDFYVARAGD